MSQKKYRRKEYPISSGKIKEEVTLVLLTDLHGNCYGRQNQILAEDILKEKPDLVLIAGDMVNGKKNPGKWRLEAAASLLEKLPEQTNVCYGYGNHESKLLLLKGAYEEAFLQYRQKLQKAGIHFLADASMEITVKHTTLKISGLELERVFYKKMGNAPMEENYLTEKLGKGQSEQFHILLAHNPHYGKQYLSWGADLILSGHMHGGVVGFPGCGGVISPQFRLFDPYMAGRFDYQGRTLLVSRGLGDHERLPRIWNPREYLVIRLLPIGK